MKNCLLVIVLFFLTHNLTALENDTNLNPWNSDTNSKNTETIIKNAFYTNATNDLLFIDLDDIKIPLLQVNVIQNGKILMVEDLNELPQNMIYEIELTLFQAGEYEIELITADEIKIRKSIVIKH